MPGTAHRPEINRSYRRVDPLPDRFADSIDSRPTPTPPSVRDATRGRPMAHFPSSGCEPSARTCRGNPKEMTLPPAPTIRPREQNPFHKTLHDPPPGHGPVFPPARSPAHSLSLPPPPNDSIPFPRSCRTRHSSVAVTLPVARSPFSLYTRSANASIAIVAHQPTAHPPHEGLAA